MKSHTKSFEEDAFTSAKRPLHLYLRSDKITYLEEKIFAPFFFIHPNNRLILYENPIDCCDTRSKWIIKDKDKLDERIGPFVLITDHCLI